MPKFLKKKKRYNTKEKIAIVSLCLIIAGAWAAIGVKAATTWSAPDNVSTVTVADSSGELYGRPSDGKCGPNNAKTVFVDKLVPGDDRSYRDTIDLIKPLCILGNLSDLSGGADTEPKNNTDGCMAWIYKCGSITCHVSICSSNQKGKATINGGSFRYCGDGILDADLGEECDNSDGRSADPRDFGLPGLYENNNPYYSHMFGHSCADKGFCGTAICTDKCKVDYSGCTPCIHIPPNDGQGPDSQL